MACFVVPAVEAVITTAVTKVIEKKEKTEAKNETVTVSGGFSKKLKWLNNMLWGGSALLAFEHIWHGEVVPWFPFLTNAIDPANRAEMLHEMATAGVSMTILVTAVWAGIVAVTGIISRSAVPAESKSGRN
ncbi:MAG: hypothetical protein Q4F63_02485 [Clostridia bacterium]|nr:hypothetical protein [Clostridia bacterium]